MTYSYGALNRLTLAQTTGPEWGQRFVYDGFGNRTVEGATKGTAYTTCLSYDAASEN